MLWFRERLHLKKLYERWREDRGALDSPANVISFLTLHELINEEAARQYIADHEKELIPDGEKVTDEH